jgi:hypothetical protein
VPIRSGAVGGVLRVFEDRGKKRSGEGLGDWIFRRPWIGIENGGGCSGRCVGVDSLRHPLRMQMMGSRRTDDPSYLAWLSPQKHDFSDATRKQPRTLRATPMDWIPGRPLARFQPDNQDRSCLHKNH